MKVCFLVAFECLLEKCPPAPRWLMTSEELSTYEAESYPPPCVDPSFFEGPYGPRHGWAMIPQSLYKTENNAGRCWNSSCDRFGARFVTVHPKNLPKSLVLLQIRKIPKVDAYDHLSLRFLRHLASWSFFNSCLHVHSWLKWGRAGLRVGRERPGDGVAEGLTVEWMQLIKGLQYDAT